jgi:DNA-directed RNA polymerase specialized sigma24 family protein
MISDIKFGALADLLRLRDSPSREAARLVLVDGLKPADAARQTGTTPQAVSNALASCRRGLALVAIIAGTSPPDY